MKTVVYTPKAVSGFTTDEGLSIPPSFSGQITLRVPTFFERQTFKALLVGVVAQNGEADLATIRDAGKQKLNIANIVESMSKLVEASVPFYQAVELRKLSDGSELKSFDDLSMDPDAEGILQEVAQTLASGLSLSKN
jgi:hypothetical protein